jgi:NhaA family Na+:H+ antiporter
MEQNQSGPENVIAVVQKPPIQRILKPFQKFFTTQASGGIILLIIAIIAITWANSPWGDSYFALWNMPVSFSIGGFTLDKPLIIWINDLLMAVFFFVVGLEIKRELMIGELSSVRQASLPIFAALGGMIVPALLYTAFNAGSETISGWGIPMATDIAFAIGILALLGDKVPLALKIFLTALAIVDDLGAVIVIAVFYTAELSIASLLLGGVVVAALIICNRLHIRHIIIYSLLGLILWFLFLKSGVHPTIAGVILAFTIPVRARINSALFTKQSQEIITGIKTSENIGDHVPATSTFNSSIFELESLCEQIQSPMQRIEHKLHYWVAFFIMPVFALANAGLQVDVSLLSNIFSSVSIGIILGLVIGKMTGIFLFSWLSVKLKISELPSAVKWPQLFGVSCLGGIGFTMSLFIASLAFTKDIYMQEAKLGILTASFLAGIIGIIVLKRTYG